MAKSVDHLFGTAYAFTESSGTSDINGSKIVNDYPPNEENVASIFIHNDGTGSAGITITVKCQLYSGQDWGTLHNVTDENGDNITFDAGSDTDVEANMYAQTWWKLNQGFRVVLSRSGATSLSGTATAVTT